jgi:hypothetical protein
MREFNRRTVVGMSISAATLLSAPARAVAATCVSGFLPGFLPAYLTVDCASSRNFRLFRQNSDYLGLVGVVSMTTVRGKLGTYQAGNLFLFPWLKPKGAALGQGKVWNASVATSATAYRQASPIPSARLPQDEYFCNFVLQAPENVFIGFTADVPFGKLEAKLNLFTNVDKLADGKPVGIDWASSNLNHPWFGGSQAIPATDTCNGNAWRKLIVAGLNQTASAGAC